MEQGGDFSPFIRPYSPSNNMIFSSNGLNSNTAKAIIHSHAQKPPTVLRRSASNNSATETLLSLTHNKPGVPGNSASSLRRQVSHDDNSWAQDYIAILEAGQQSSMQQPREASSPLMIQVPSSSSFQTHHAKHRASPSPSTTTTTPSNSLVLNTAMILSRADSFASQMDFLDISAINPCNQSTNQLHSMPTFSIMNPLSITNQTIDITTMDVLGDDLDKENVSPLPTPSFVVREASPRPPLQVINELSVLEDDDHYVVDEEEDVDGANLADVAFLQSQSRSLLTQSSSPEQHKAQLPADHSGSAFDKEENDSLTLQDSSRSTSSLAPPALDRSIDFEPRNHLPLQSMPPMMSLTVASKASKPCSFSEIEARNSSASNEMRSPSRFVHTASPARNSAGPVVNSTASSGMGKFDYMTMDVSYVVIPPNTDHHREVDHEAPVAMISDEGEEEEDEENVSFDLNDEHGFDDEEEDGVDESAEEIDSGNDFDPDDDEELGESTLMSLDFSSRLDNHKLYLQQQGRFDFFQHDAAPSVQLPEDYQEDEGDYENDISDDTYEHYASEKQDSIGPLRHFRIEESSISIATNKSASSYSSSMEELTSMTAGPCIAYAYLEESLNSSVGMADLSQHHNTSYGLSASNVRRGSRSPLKGVHREAASNTSPRAKTPISIEQVEQQQLQDAAFCPDPVAVQLYNNSHASPATEHLQINGLARTFIPLRLHEEEQE